MEKRHFFDGKIARILSLQIKKILLNLGLVLKKSAVFLKNLLANSTLVWKISLPFGRDQKEISGRRSSVGRATDL